jgi:hypothetical protein
MSLSSEKLFVDAIIRADIVNTDWFSADLTITAKIQEGFSVNGTVYAKIIPDIKTEYLKSPQAPTIEVTF